MSDIKSWNDLVGNLKPKPMSEPELESAALELATETIKLKTDFDKLTKDNAELVAALKLLLDYADEGTAAWRERFDKFFALLARLSQGDEQ